MYLITAYFDDKTSNCLQSWVQKIADVSGNTFMPDHQVPAHLTLASIEARNADVLLPSFYQLDGFLYSGSIDIVSIGMLLPYVIYTTPVLNEYLLHLHKQVCDTFASIPHTTISKYYQPYSWLPHVTLGKTLNKEQMQKALLLMQNTFHPISGQVTRIGLSKVNPHEDLANILLNESTNLKAND